jgi:hypothetical protein
VVTLLEVAFIINVRVFSIAYPPAAPAPYQVQQFTNTSLFGAIETDIDGDLIVAVANARTTTVVRMPHQPNATPQNLANTPGSVFRADIVPAAGIVAMFENPNPNGAPLHRYDTVAQQSSAWSHSGPVVPINVSVHDNPANYGRASSQTGVQPFLGSAGGRAAVGNGGFAIRAGGSAGGAGILLLSRGRGSTATSFGELLLDPTLLLPVATFALPGGRTTIPMGLPADPNLKGASLTLQGIIVAGFAPVQIEMTPGLAVVIE